MSFIDGEIVKEFLVESFENLDQLDQDFVTLENNPQDPEVLKKIFRTVHTIKGTCGFLEFSKLESIAHVGENLLDELRSGRVAVTSEVASALLHLVDALRSLMRNIEIAGDEGETDYSVLIQTLSDLKGGKPFTSSDESTVNPDSREDGTIEDGDKAPIAVEGRKGADSTDVTAEEVNEEGCANHDLIAEIMASDDFQSESITSTQETDGGALQGHKEIDLDLLGSPVEKVRVDISTTQSVNAKKEKHMSSNEKKTRQVKSSSSKNSIVDSTLRVDVSLLDTVMNLVGELVLARNQILQFTKTHSDAGFINTCQRLNLITSELQEGVMKTRMQPIANVWNKFPRVVRDVAKACAKEIKIEMEGHETELDKTILEAIKDPLTHIVRNSADHGIELPEIREANGKPREGTLTLRAFHEGGHVIIEIGDDGAGIDTERVKAKAIEKGIIAVDRVHKMSDSEVHRLIFHAGFSTADKVTNVSGRGVGMDVVKSNIEKIGGSVDVQSQSGIGTLLKIKIPLTLAIVPALIVSCNEQRFAIPQVSLLELLRVENGIEAEEIESIGGALFYRLRGNLLPLIDLQKELQVNDEDEVSLNAKVESETESDTEDDSSVAKSLNIIVVRAENKDFGLIVQAVHDTEEIVVKPLGRQIKDIPVFAGATIMGDGKVALILDVLGVAQCAQIVDAQSEGGTAEIEEHEDSSSLKRPFLLVRIGNDGRLAIPLEQVHRLEEFAASQLEKASGRNVVQYRDGILPLLDLSHYLRQNPGKKHEILPVVVYTEGEKSIGFVVDQILDIVEENVSVSYNRGCNGIVGSAVIQGKVTDLLDIQAVLVDQEPSFSVSSQDQEIFMGA